MTYSIVAYSPSEQAWGAGVASKFLAVGALVGSENLEERWNLERDTDVIDSMALKYLREQFGS